MSEFAGALRERIELERRVDERDSYAGAKPRFVYDGAAWASVTPLVPADLVAADTLSFKPRWRVTMRKRESIGAHTRIIWRRHYLLVRGIEIDPRTPGQMILNCEEAR
jgi:head-tail adaptor